eukprot:scaffold33495_cov105-Skeletonema_dohrnii-CCMP3373.AAC.7
MASNMGRFDGSILAHPAAHPPRSSPLCILPAAAASLFLAFAAQPSVPLAQPLLWPSPKSLSPRRRRFCSYVSRLSDGQEARLVRQKVHWKR